MNFGPFLTVSMRNRKNSSLNLSGKVILAHTIIEKICSGNHPNEGVLLFSLENTKTTQKIAVGVEEFTADSASVIVPDWILEHIGLAENDKVKISWIRYPAAKSVIFQPLTRAFNELPNVRVILEHSLRNFPCLTEGTLIPVEFNNSIYKLKVLKSEPEKSVCIVHADVVTDFARPLSDFDHHWGEEEEHCENSTTKSAFRGKAHIIKG